MSFAKKAIIVTSSLCFSALMWTSTAFAAEITVQKNDTLWAIAQKNGTTVDTIKNLNNLKSDLLQIGQILKLPDANNAPATRSEDETPKAASRNSSGRVDELLKFAESLLGSKYRYGGETPAGFDCSGYVRYVYKHFGIDLIHSSAAQFKSNGVAVEKSDLQPADLVYFNTSGKGISHVGIYLGNRQFIHSASPGSGVKISSLDDKYWSPKYRGAKRVILAQNEQNNE